LDHLEVFPNRQIFLEHFHLPQAGSVANIPESGVQHLGNKCKVIAQKTIRHRPNSLIANTFPLHLHFTLTCVKVILKCTFQFLELPGSRSIILSAR
jgi:hypothetical protein